MDLDFDEATEEFRAEVRDFLAANVRAVPDEVYDTAEGFEQHRAGTRCSPTPACR